MGLDVVAYSKLTPAKGGSGVIFNISGMYAPLPLDVCSGMLYAYEERSGFRAGSYSSYNAWRNELARVAGYEPAANGRYDETVWQSTGGPFWEMINFTDCNGVLGTAVCKKLHSDFVAFRDIAIRGFSDGDMLTYEQFETSFKLAADGGCVMFG